MRRELLEADKEPYNTLGVVRLLSQDKAKVEEVMADGNHAVIRDPERGGCVHRFCCGLGGGTIRSFFRSF